MYKLLGTVPSEQALTEQVWEEAQKMFIFNEFLMLLAWSQSLGSTRSSYPKYIKYIELCSLI